MAPVAPPPKSATDRASFQKMNILISCRSVRAVAAIRSCDCEHRLTPGGGVILRGQTSPFQELAPKRPQFLFGTPVTRPRPRCAI